MLCCAMSEPPPDNRSTQLINLLEKSQAFAEKILSENEKSRREYEALEVRCRAAERERDELRERFHPSTTEAPKDNDELREIEAELNNLANLHVATWQLHGSLKLSDAVSVVVEICLNLVGVSSVALYLHDEKARRLLPVKSHGLEEAPTIIDLDSPGPVSEALASGSAIVREDSMPVAVVPLSISGRLIGVLVMEQLLPHKEGLSDLDYEFFDLLGRQAANAILSAYLAATSDIPLSAEGIEKALGTTD